MMTLPRIQIFFYSMFSTFIVFLVLFFIVFSGQESGMLEVLFSRTFLSIPLLVYLFTFSIIVGFLNYFLVTWIERNNDKKIEENLRHLVRGEYDEAIQFEITEGSLLSTNVQIHHNIHLLARKLNLMNEQLQTLNVKSSFEGSQTREEILTQERHRLSRELHDSVSQQLFAAMMILSGLNEVATATEAIPPAFAKQLGIVTDVINTAQSEMRALLLHLRPIELSGKSLKQGIEGLLRELESKIKIKLIWDIEDVKLPSAIEDHLFRIMQELLSNTLRHAKADELEVYLRKMPSTVLLRVIDDGVGFEQSKALNKTASYGLKNIQERVTGMGGEVKIVSFKGQGTSVELKIPIIN